MLMSVGTCPTVSVRLMTPAGTCSTVKSAALVVVPVVE